MDEWAPPVDTSQADWPNTLFQGKQFFRDDSPTWEWTPVLHPDSEVESPPVGLSGIAVRPRLSNLGDTGDLAFTHMFGNDWTVDLILDEPYRNLLAIGNTNGNQPGQDPDVLESIRIAQDVMHSDPTTNFGSDVKGVIHCEIDRGPFPHHFRALQGDRIAMVGRWIVDTGHNNPYGAEVHPPLLLACARPVSSSETYVSVIARPFLSSQKFGSGGLRAHVDAEVAHVLLDPTYNRIRIQPNAPYTTPFSGIVLALLQVRPPTPRKSSADTLAVEFHFTTRPGVAIQVGTISGGDDAVTLAISMNDASYVPASLPARNDHFVNPNDLAKAQPDFGSVLQTLVLQRQLGLPGKGTGRRILYTSGMITKDEVMSLLLTACPSFQQAWEDHQAEWEDRDLLYLDLGAFACHLVALLQADRTEEFPAVFAMVERLHAEGTRFVREATTIGLLEGMQNHAEHAGLNPERFLPFLGPASREWWRQLDAFWSGRIRYVGETYAQPETTGDPTAG